MYTLWFKLGASLNYFQVIEANVSWSHMVKLIQFLFHWLAQIMAQALPPDRSPGPQSEPQQHWAAADAAKIAKITAKITKINIVIGSFWSNIETMN